MKGLTDYNILIYTYILITDDFVYMVKSNGHIYKAGDTVAG